MQSSFAVERLHARRADLEAQAAGAEAELDRLTQADAGIAEIAVALVRARKLEARLADLRASLDLSG